MPLRRLARNAREVFAVPRDLLLGRYPAFVTGGALPRGHVPVFVFHSLDPVEFGAKLRYLADNGYVTRAEADAAKAEELLTVQGGAVPSARSSMPPRDYFTDEIRRQLSAKLGDDALFTGGLTIRATVDPDLQEVAARALRDGLEKYDRAVRVYRGPVAEIKPRSVFSSTFFLR